MRAVWITWEKQQRNRSMARALGIPLLEVELSCSRLSRYLRSMWRTFVFIRHERPDIVFFQNPSVVLGLWLICLKTFWPTLRFSIVGDFHNSALEGPCRRLSQFIARSCRLIIVTNEPLARTVEEWGGRSFSLPDPLPEFEMAPARSSGRATFDVLFICSWAADEPVEEVLAAAAELVNRSPEVKFRFTGRPKKERISGPLPPNVSLTGFLSDDDFKVALASTQVVMDLTTRENCMVCGAYEGLAMGKPLILSRNAPTVEWFNDAGVYCDNTSSSIAAAVQTALESYEHLTVAAERRIDYLRQKHDSLMRQLLLTLDPPVLA